ncbi:patatin-like phospholipase family protein [Aquimarina sp. I32.4]|uniref:patatin-like phospholipase family protein n=1 Tax=Aquimarina sp. I32.4 TaxID=2053903 RepID=UPI000CDEAFE0|nr:patatin-like phospholipase family protein [Aquimarina sp. I32.4]
MVKLLLFFQRFSIWFKTLIGELYNNLISLFFILSLYFALWHFPQTLDLLLILNQADAFLFEVPLYFFLLMASAFLIWNIPKYFYFYNYKDITFYNLIGFVPNQHYKFQRKNKYARYHYKVRVHMRKVVPRILALLLLIISALSILNAMKVFELENIYTSFFDPTNTLISSIFFLLFFTEPIFYEHLKNFVTKIPKTNTFIVLLSVGLVIFIISLGTLNTQTEKDLGNLFLSNYALVLFFFTLSFNSYNFLKEFPEKLFYGTVLVAGFILLISFLVLNFIPEWAGRINPLSILILSLVSLFMISFILILCGKKLKMPLFTITVILSLFFGRLFSKESDHYQLDLKKSTVVRATMEEYIYQWIKSREEIIKNQEGCFPAIIVSSEGGGSRAGLWSFLVHSYLYEKSNGEYFEKNLLSLTGASGGSVGNALFFAEAQRAMKNDTTASFKIKQNKENRYPVLKYKASAIYKENYLSVALLSFLGRDLFKEVTSLFRFKNRGQLLEEQWSTSYKNYFLENNNGEDILQKEFLSFYENITDAKGKIINKTVPPLLFINTTHTQTGSYNMISPVKYSHLRELTGMNDFIDNLQMYYPDTSIGLSTAMRINASFPYITPVGEVKKVSESGRVYSDQYADAGYYDNIGGRVSKGVEEVFKQILRDSFPGLQAKIKLKHLVIANDEERKIIKTQTQLQAPLTTLQNVRYGHTREITKKLGSNYSIMLKPTMIPLLNPEIVSKDTEKEALLIKPLLPLGRYLSTVAIRSIEARLNVVKPELNSILTIN